ncbi:DUF5937 family protein [Streptomyces coryli]|uniref:DUF5937 family protein n=1 Tax=Streptomyces coryli TaxID=1128680 RepID=UPI0019D29BE5|nr:DUF5937 family protein [Streptomyces coryli]
MDRVSITIDVTGLPPERITFAPSPLAELGAMLHALSEPAHHPGLHSWATATTAALKPVLADRLTEADFMWRSARSDLLAPPRPGATLAEDLDWIDSLDNRRFVKAAFEISCNSSYESTVSPLDDADERAKVLELAAARGPRQAQFTERMLDDPDGLRIWLRRLFEDCEQAFFGDTWQRIRVQLAADARHKTELLQRKGLAETVSAVSEAIRLEEYGTGGQRLVLDKLSTGTTSATAEGGLTFLPSAFGWPHLFAGHAPGWQPVILYPVATPELPRPEALELVQARLEALAHPMRMRLTRMLARSSHSTGELATAFGITAPEVSRHLAVLKKAGLITTRRRGRYVLHQLDLQTVARLGSDFLETVLR